MVRLKILGFTIPGHIRILNSFFSRLLGMLGIIKNSKVVMAKSVNKLSLWFKHFTNEASTTTFLNKSNSARAAKYKCKDDQSFRNVGCQNYTKLYDKINQWLDEEGLTEIALKTKMLSLMNADETKIVKIKGAMDPDSLPGNCVIIGTTGIIETDDEGSIYSTGESLVAVNLAAIETQRRTLDMAMKVRGMFKEDNKQLQPTSFNFNVMPKEKND